MSENLISGRRSRRKAKANCRAEQHRFGSGQVIGGGILRRVCSACGAVSIDLTSVEDPVTIGAFRDRESLRGPR